MARTVAAAAGSAIDGDAARARGIALAANAMALLGEVK